MPKGATAPVSNDRELIAYMGLTVDDVARHYGRSRVMIEAKLTENERSARQPYLSVCQIVELRLLTHLRGMTGCDDSVLFRYIEQHRRGADLESAESAFKRMAEPTNLGGLYEIATTIPDVKGLIQSGRAEFLRELVALPSALIFFLTSSLAKERLIDFLGQENLAEREPTVTFRAGSYVSAQETRVFGNPESIYVWTFVAGKTRLIYESTGEARMKSFVNQFFERTTLC